jgi:hypothetical protein
VATTGNILTGQGDGEKQKLGKQKPESENTNVRLWGTRSRKSAGGMEKDLQTGRTGRESRKRPMLVVGNQSNGKSQLDTEKSDG